LAGPAPEEAKLRLAEEVISRRLSVRQTEKLVKQHARPRADLEHQALEQQLTETLGTRVRLLTRANGTGKVEIDFYSLEELNGLVDRFTRYPHSNKLLTRSETDVIATP